MSRRMLFLIATALLHLARSAFGQDLAVYDNPAVGLRFSYPSGVRLSVNGEAQAAESAPADETAGLATAAPAEAPADPGYRIDVRLLPLPLQQEDLFGFTNHNMQKLREGLTRGRIVGFPLNYPQFSSVVRLPRSEQSGRARYAIENYLLYATDPADIRFDIALDLFQGGAFIRIRISAEPVSEQILRRYLGKTFEKVKNRYQWITIDHVSRFIELARREREFSPVADWLRLKDAVLENLELY